MKAAQRTLVPLLTLALLLGACAGDDNTDQFAEPAELSVQILSPADGEQIAGNVVDLQVAAEGLEIVEADGDTSGDTGHFHVFIDRDPVAPGETISNADGIFHFSGDRVRIPGLAVGTRKLTLVLGDGSHVRLGRVSAVVEVEVTGPSITAQAPETAPLATGFNLQTTADGVEIGADNHLDFIIDPPEEPEADGRPIPADSGHIHTSGTSHQVTGLGEGEHVIWVVLVDEDHVPVSPLVADKVTIRIR